MSEHQPEQQVLNKPASAGPGKTAKPISKLATGIAGLDEVLHGGFPEKRTTLLKGAAGTGKTVLGLEFLYRAAAGGRPAVLVSFEEAAKTLRENALATGWDISALEKSGRFFLWNAKIDRRAVTSGDFDISSLLGVVKGKAEQIGASLIMIDAVDVLMGIFEDLLKERNELYRLHDWLAEQQFTALLTAKAHRDPAHTDRYEFLDYMADCIVKLDMRVENQVATRRLRVIKYRGSGFCANEYPYIITAGGNVVMPITEMRLRHRPPGGRVSCGDGRLDDLLGGGLFRGSSVLLAGGTGTGKTTMAANFAEKACAAGGRMLYISFEESQPSIIESMRSAGIDLRPATKNGNLQFHTIMPESLAVEEHLYRVLHKMEGFRPDHVVVDAISACKRMGPEGAPFDFVARLVDSCKSRGITCLLINQHDSSGSQTHLSGVGASSIIDTLIVLRFVEIAGRVQRDLLIVKSRGTAHSNRHHRFCITDNGIRFEAYKTAEGI